MVPLLDVPAVEALRAATASWLPVEAGGMAFSDHALGPADRAALFEAVEPIVAPAAARLLRPHRVVSASLVAKYPGPEGEMDWHVDPAITDERHHRSLSLWIPVDGVEPDDGALDVLDGGHAGTPLDRGGRGVLSDTHPDHEQVLARCRAQALGATGPLAVAAGHAVAYDHRLPHRSGPNQRSTTRLVLNVGLLPAEAPLLIHIWRDDRTVDAHAVPLDFLRTQDLARPPADWPEASRVTTHLHPGPGETGSAAGGLEPVD